MNDKTKEKNKLNNNKDNETEIKTKETKRKKEGEKGKIYTYNEDKREYEELVPTGAIKIEIADGEIRDRIKLLRNIVSKGMKLRPDLSVFTSVLLELGLECDVELIAKTTLKYYKDRLG